MFNIPFLRGLLTVQSKLDQNHIDDKIRRAVDYAVSTVEKGRHDETLTAMAKVALPRVEIAMKSGTGSSGHGPNSEVQNLDRMVFLGNAINTPFMSDSCRLDLNTNQERNDETRNEENFEDGDFPALRPNYDRRAPAHHMPCELRLQVFEKQTRFPTENMTFMHTW